MPRPRKARRLLLGGVGVIVVAGLAVRYSPSVGDGASDGTAAESAGEAASDGDGALERAEAGATRRAPDEMIADGPRVPTSAVVLGHRRAIVAAYPLLLESGLTFDDLDTTSALLAASAGREGAFAGIYERVGAIDLIREQMAPESILPMLAQAEDTSSATLLANVIAQRLRETSEDDLATHRAYSVAAALAVVSMSDDERFSAGQRASFATSVLRPSFADAPDTVLRLLEATPGLTGRPEGPDASFAYVHRMLMDLYAERRDAEGFRRAADAWMATDWPQRDVDRAWREQRVARLGETLGVRSTHSGASSSWGAEPAVGPKTSSWKKWPRWDLNPHAR